MKILLLLLCSCLPASAFTLTLTNLRAESTVFLVRWDFSGNWEVGTGGAHPVAVAPASTVVIEAPEPAGLVWVNAQHVADLGTESTFGWIQFSAELSGAAVWTDGGYESGGVWQDEALSAVEIQRDEGMTSNATLFWSGLGLAALVRVTRAGLRWTRRASHDFGPGGDA